MRKHRKRKNPRPENYSEYLQSDEWKKIRERVLRREGHRCIICNATATNVHHRHYHGTGEEQQRDLLSLCRSCHEWVHENDVYLPRAKKGRGKRASSRRNVKRVARAAGHPNVFDDPKPYSPPR